MPPDPEINSNLNKNCILKLSMHPSEFSFQLMYDENLLKIKAGEEVELKNVFQQARLDQQLALETDTGCCAQLISFSQLTQTLDKTEYKLDLLKNYKPVGSCTISTQLEWREPDPFPQNLNSKCKLNLTILECTWNEKPSQNTFVQFTYGFDEMRTFTKDNQWNESLELANIKQRIMLGEELVLRVYEEDVNTHLCLAATRPISWQDFCQDQDP